MNAGDADATPNSTHPGFASQAALAGKHVLCEKPLAITVEGCRQTIAACRRHGVTLMFGRRRRSFFRLRRAVSHGLCLALLVLLAAFPLRAQQPAGGAGTGNADGTSQPQSPPRRTPAVPPQATHRFWDRKNDWWFAGVGAARALDYSSTLNLRRRGLNEILLTNSVVDNHPLFAGIEVAAVGVSIGVSYVFHRTGHHRLERWTSIVHFGVAVGGAARNYALKTPHPA